MHTAADGLSARVLTRTVLSTRLSKTSGFDLHDQYASLIVSHNFEC
jgi:hypothetical protein